MSVPFLGALDEYFDWESQSWVEILADLEGNEKDKFLPIDTVRQYFTKRSDNDDDNDHHHHQQQQQSNLDKILSEIFNLAFPPIDSDLILRQYICVFCILLSIERGRYIERFTCFEELSDQRLPFDQANPPRYFPTINDDSKFLQEFCDAQKRYCVPTFDSHMLHKHFGNQRLLPITFKKRLDSRGPAKSHIIGVHSLNNKMVKPPNKEIPPHTDTFFLKSYSTAEDLASYVSQVNAFRNVRNADGIINFYGSFEYGTESHILLEFADKGTLDEFFKNETPPSRDVEIINFWENLLKLVKGLKAIQSSKGYDISTYNIYKLTHIRSHQQVCCENIRVISNGSEHPSNWQFKFSDTGLVSECITSPQLLDFDYRSRKSTIGQVLTPLESIDNKFSCRSLKSPASADIWRLGYVFSNAALWVVDGYKGILDFQKQLDIEGMIIKGNEHFHEDKRLSGKIFDAHAEIENRLRRSDYVTKDILSFMIDEMLWDEDKPDVEALVRKAETVITRARQTLAEVSLDKKPIYRRSHSQYSKWPSSPPPPLPPLDTAYHLDASPTRSQLPQRVESWRIKVTNNPISLSTRTSIFSGLGSEISNPQVALSQLNHDSVGRMTPDNEIDVTATSWFLDSPSSDSPNTPLSSSAVSVLRRYSQSSESNQQSDMALSSETGRSVEPSLKIDINQRSDTNEEVLDTRRNEPVINNELDTSLHYETPLRGALQTLPSQESSFEYRLPPLLPRNSLPKNSKADSLTLLQSPSETFVSNYERHGSLSSLSNKRHSEWCRPSQPLSRPNTGTGTNRRTICHHPYQSEDSHNPMPSITNDSRFFETIEKPTMPSRISTNESVYSTIKSSLGSKCSRSRIGSNILSKGRNISSAIKLKRNSMLPIADSNISAAKSDSGLATLPDPLNESSKNESEFLNIDTCRQWKQLSKCSKKKSTVPSLPNLQDLQPLEKCDHVFIVDDSFSMAPNWTETCKVFEGLSFILKDVLPLSIDLCFTISNDTRRRKGSHDLCNYLSERKLQRNQTNIAKRLELQLSAYRTKLKNSKKDVKNIRPINFYILSNGLWAPESEIALRETLEQTFTLLSHLGLKNQVLISFIGLENNSVVANRVKALSRINWEGCLKIRWNLWTGNVWEMLRGDLNDVDEAQNEQAWSQNDYIESGKDGTIYQVCETDDMRLNENFKKKKSIMELEGIYELA